MQRHRVLVPIVVAIFGAAPLLFADSQLYPGNTALVVLLVGIISCLLMGKNRNEHKP